MTDTKMKVEIWSDIMCPFCYIGKRHYEAALKEFAHRDDVEIEWHSFQLDPSIPADVGKNQGVYEYLAKKKGMSYDQSVKMHQNVVDMAKRAGLDYNFDIAKIANSFKAHRMIQLAKAKGLGDAIEEQLFHAYFTEGKDLGDAKELAEVGKRVGLSDKEVNESLTDETYSAGVNHDIEEARALGVNGVPFFVFNRKYAISGAQPPEAFLQTLETSFSDWKQKTNFQIQKPADGAVCTADGECD